MEKKILFRQVHPQGVLGEYVESFWEANIDKKGGVAFEEKILPYGFTEVGFAIKGKAYGVKNDGARFALPSCGTTNFVDESIKIEMAGPIHIFSMRLRPGVLNQLSGITDQSEIANTILETRDVFKPGGQEFSERILAAGSFQERTQLAENFLVQQIKRQKDEKKMMKQVAQHIIQKKGNVSISELTSLFPLSDRHLQREFKQKIGVSPKSFARMVRFNYAFKYMKNSINIDWQDVIFQCGYYDQAHFIREFGEFTGKSPLALLSETSSNLQLWEHMTGKVA